MQMHFTHVSYAYLSLSLSVSLSLAQLSTEPFFHSHDLFVYPNVLFTLNLAMRVMLAQLRGEQKRGDEGREASVG